MSAIIYGILLTVAVIWFVIPAVRLMWPRQRLVDIPFARRMLTYHINRTTFR